MMTPQSGCWRERGISIPSAKEWGRQSNIQTFIPVVLKLPCQPWQQWSPLPHHPPQGSDACHDLQGTRSTSSPAPFSPHWKSWSTLISPTISSPPSKLFLCQGGKSTFVINLHYTGSCASPSSWTSFITILFLRLEFLILEGNSLRSLPTKIFSEATRIRSRTFIFTHHLEIIS